MSLANPTNIKRLYSKLHSSIYQPCRLLGLDIGDRYIGLAMDDAQTHSVVTHYTTIQRKVPLLKHQNDQKYRQSYTQQPRHQYQYLHYKQSTHRMTHLPIERIA